MSGMPVSEEASASPNEPHSDISTWQKFVTSISFRSAPQPGHAFPSVQLGFDNYPCLFPQGVGSYGGRSFAV